MLIAAVRGPIVPVLIHGRVVCTQSSELTLEDTSLARCRNKDTSQKRPVYRPCRVGLISFNGIMGIRRITESFLLFFFLVISILKTFRVSAIDLVTCSAQ